MMITVCDDYCSSFEELLNRVGSLTIHQRNRRALAIEMFEIFNWLSSTLMVEMMDELDIPYQTRWSCQIKLDIDSNITDVSKN